VILASLGENQVRNHGTSVEFEIRWAFISPTSTGIAYRSSWEEILSEIFRGL
jgi:hypothetical protein